MVCILGNISYCRENIFKVREFVLYSKPDLELPILYHQGGVECSGRGEIKLMRYTDTKLMDQEYKSPTSDFYFSPIEIKDADGKVLHKIAQTELDYWNEQDFDLSQVSQLADPISIDFPTNKNVYVDIEVWDYDGSNYNSANDFVRSMTNMHVPFNLKQITSFWYSKTYRSSPNEEASLKFHYKILECDEGFDGYGCNSCADNYYPAGQCTKFCKPETNKYTCTSEGNKECLENYYPAGQCTKFCEPETNKYTCTSEGNKECLENYYPAGQCTKFCEPETNKYTCTSEGEKECIGNREGSQCDECTVNFYGDDCSHFCEESDGHVCSKDGNKECKTHYYPEGTCSNFCIEASSYICNKDGSKACRDYYYPEGKCSAYCAESPFHICDEKGSKICNSHQYPQGNCSIFCQPNEDYSCSLQGSKVCNDETADPEKECKKANIAVYAGIGGGVAVFIVLISVITWVCRRRTCKSDKKKDRSVEQDEIYDTLDVAVEDSTVRKIQGEPSSSRYDEMSQEFENARAVKGKPRERSYSEYIDMNSQCTNTEADVRIHITEDTDVVYSTIDQKNPIHSACKENPDDSLYSTLHDKDAFGLPTAPSTAGTSENGDTVYSTLHGKEILFTTATNRTSHYDCDNDDGNYVDDDLDAMYSKIDRGNRDARSEGMDDVDDDEPVYATVNKKEVALFESKDVSRPMSGYYNTQDILPSEREIPSATDDIVSEIGMKDQNDAIYINQETSSLFDFVDDPSALYSTINK